MKRKYHRYNKEHLSKIVSESNTFSEVCRKYGKSPVGGTITNIKLMCNKWNISYQHMSGQGWSKGKTSLRKKPAHEHLVTGNKNSHRVNPKKLTRCLLEMGLIYKCNMCNIGNNWNNKELILEVDHIDGVYWNNVISNLQFLCPNCHSQKTKGL